jgi:hypothetical protein
LATPVTAVYHDATNSESGFASVMRNQTPKDQFRFTGQLRNDHFDIPYDPSNTDYEYTSGYYDSYGLRDAQTERDGFVIANWVHTSPPKRCCRLLRSTTSIESNYDSLPTDPTVATTWHQTRTTRALRPICAPTGKSNSFSGGVYSFYQNESDLFGFIVNDGSAASQPNTTGKENAGLVEFYISTICA